MVLMMYTAALHARTLVVPSTQQRVQRVAIVDYDVHHGNGTQQAFYGDADCLFVSLHQDNNYPQGEAQRDCIEVSTSSSLTACALIGCGSHLEAGSGDAEVSEVTFAFVIWQ